MVKTKVHIGSLPQKAEVLTQIGKVDMERVEMRKGSPSGQQSTGARNAFFHLIIYSGSNCSK